MQAASTTVDGVHSTAPSAVTVGCVLDAKTLSTADAAGDRHRIQRAPRPPLHRCRLMRQMTRRCASHRAPEIPFAGYPNVAGTGLPCWRRRQCRRCGFEIRGEGRVVPVDPERAGPRGLRRAHRTRQPLKRLVQLAAGQAAAGAFAVAGRREDRPLRSRADRLRRTAVSHRRAILARGAAAGVAGCRRSPARSPCDGSDAIYPYMRRSQAG